MNLEKLQQDYDKNQKRISYAQHYIDEAPSGYLHRVPRGKSVYYEKVETINKKKSIQYISVTDTETVISLAKKAYAQAILPELKDNQTTLEYFLDNYNPDPEATALAKLPEWEKELILEHTHIVNSSIIKEWLAETYNQNPYKPEQRCIETLRGDCVRSKAERDIADALFRHRIPYRTDCEFITSGGTIYADFVILHPQSLEEYYWEHSGMLDSAGYVGRNFDRIARYAAEGILVGERLILTGETSRHVFGTASIERIIDAYFG